MIAVVSLKTYRITCPCGRKHALRQDRSKNCGICFRHYWIAEDAIWCRSEPGRYPNQVQVIASTWDSRLKQWPIWGVESENASSLRWEVESKATLTYAEAVAQKSRLANAPKAQGVPAGTIIQLEGFSRGGLIDLSGVTLSDLEPPMTRVVLDEGAAHRWLRENPVRTRFERIQ